MTSISLCVCTLLFASASDANASRMKTIYVLPMSHLDIGFTHTPGEVRDKMIEATDEALDEAAKNPDYVWNVETFWQLDQWLRNGPEPQRVQQLVELVRAGRFGVGAAYLTPHSALMTDWMLERLCEPATTWAGPHGLTLTWAVLNDVPGHPPDMPRFFARAGVKYLAIGANQGLSPALRASYCNRPFWWEAPTGERVLTWISAEAYTDAYMDSGIDPGSARWFKRDKFKGDDLAVMRQGITETLRHYTERNYQYDAVMAFHAFDNWGSGASRRLPEAARQWNEAGEGPKIVIATPDAFFEHILADPSVTLPIYRGGFGGAWDRLKVATPSTWQHMQAAEAAYRQANLTAADARVIALLTLYGHTFPLGAGWPGILTEDQTLRHNREQGEFVAALRVEGRPWPVRGEPAPLPAAGTGMPAANTLYRAKGVSIWQAVGDNLEPVEPGAWTALPPRRTADDTWQLRHRIDRKALGTQRTSIVWAWPIRTPAERLRPRVQTATGWMQIPDELLDQQFHNGWLSPRATQFDGIEVTADVPLAFCVSPKAYPNWVFAQCLGQGFKATFNGGAERTLTFEETYPYEPPVAEFTIEVRPLKRDGD